MDCFKVVKCSMSYESKFDILVGNHRRSVLRAKEEGDLTPYHQRSVQNPAYLMVWGCISAYGMGSLHVLDGTMNSERYRKALEQHMLPSRRRLFQQDNAKPHTADITTAWLLCFVMNKILAHVIWKSSHLYLYSAFNNTNCNKALHSIKIGKLCQ